MENQLRSWRMMQPGKPLELVEEPLPEPRAGEVLLEVLACGLCHTDVSFLYGGVRTNAPPPLTLGHEIVGRVVAGGRGAEDLLGRSFIVPAVLPCGECDLCAAGRGNICRHQKMPGNDMHGGFASHCLAPARFLCPIPPDMQNVEDLAVVADAVSTAYQSVLRSRAGAGDMVIVVGAGGVGNFAAQTARAFGAHVAALDVDPGRLDALGDQVNLTLDARALDGKQIRGAIATFEHEHGIAPHGRRILECSGTAPGQETAFSLLNHDATLMIVGFTLDKVNVRLSNLMAFDARVQGNWGCLPEHYPEILTLIRDGKIRLGPFVERHPMSRLNELLAESTHSRRPVLIPDFGGTQ